MDSATISSLAQLLGFAAPCLVAVAFAWGMFRVGSRQVVVHRLWQFVHGKQEIADPEIKKFVEEEASLLSFRMLAGVPVSSLEKAHELIRWTRSNDVQMYRLRLCGDLFDADTRQIKVHELPRFWKQRFRLVRLLLCCFLVLACAGALFFDKTLLTVNATGRYFFASTTELGSLGSAIPFGPKALKAADCSRPTSANAARSSFTEQEVTILCDVLKHSETATYLKTTLNDQRWALVRLFFIALVLLWMSFFAWVSGVSAKKLHDRHLNPSVPDSQLAFDFES